jgi:hypothetical protein
VYIYLVETQKVETKKKKDEELKKGKV